MSASAQWPVVAGIPLSVSGVQAGELSHWLLDQWEDAEPTHAPLELIYEEGETAPAGLTLVTASADAAVGSYYLDAAGELAVRACATDGAPPQLMRTVVPGRAYRVCYAPGERAGALQWRWPRNVFTYALPARRLGLVAHASGFRLASGATVLCPGVSGAGKSTLARAMRDASAAAHGVRVLSDDRVAVTVGSDSPQLWGTPWYSSAHCANGAGGPLGGIVFPARGEGATELRPVSRAEALTRLMRALAFPVWSREQMDFALDLTSAMLAAAPAFELRWTPGPDAAERVAALLDRVASASRAHAEAAHA